MIWERYTGQGHKDFLNLEKSDNYENIYVSISEHNCLYSRTSVSRTGLGP